jgi:hypothetical protein
MHSSPYELERSLGEYVLATSRARRTIIIRVHLCSGSGLDSSQSATAISLRGSRAIVDLGLWRRHPSVALASHAFSRLYLMRLKLPPPSQGLRMRHSDVA